MPSSNNQRIAKNTLMLYFRMILTMLVSLYTSRVVLNTLGVEDFGIYNVVGGFVSMFGFLNSAMASATQRFLSFEIGKGDRNQLRNVFSMSVNIHFLIAFTILILAETVGLWFVNTQLTIPAGRMGAAQWVYQFSILTMMVYMVSVPYNAMIIAHERMNVFAWVSIAEVSLKLFIVFMLQWFGFDKLKFYAVLTFCVSLIIRFIYGFYCSKHFKESKYKFNWEPKLFKRIFNHAGWMLFGTTSNMLSSQGLNMLLNIYFGVVVNAARGIAFQLQNAVNAFVNNFMTAVQPQIIKTYAQENLEEMYKLVFRSSKYSFFLLFIIALPVLLLTETILTWWLKIVPEYATIFTRLTIIDLFFTSLYPPIATVSQATGNIKYYQLAISIGFTFVFIFTLLLFKMGFPSYTAFLITIIMSFIGLFARLLVLKFQLNFPIREYYRKVLVKIIIVVIFSIPIPLLCKIIINNPINQFFIVCIISVITTISIIWLMGIEKNERQFFKVKIIEVIDKLKYKQR